jgi:hypothetical protein
LTGGDYVKQRSVHNTYFHAAGADCHAVQPLRLTVSQQLVMLVA